MNFLLLSKSFRTGLLLLHNLYFSYFHNKYEYSQTSIIQSFLCSPVSFFEHFMSDGHNNSTEKRVQLQFIETGYFPRSRRVRITDVRM